ncbi:MAG: FAD-dependent thymidylate synthase [Planktothrix sp.]
MPSSFEVEILADSLHPDCWNNPYSREPVDGMRLITYRLTYPRFIHSELLTHRLFSRNSASSRAIPISKVIQQVKTNPATPIEWGKNQSGMSAREIVTGYDAINCRNAWSDARDAAVCAAESLSGLGLHKQIVNRVLEPFVLMTCLVTSAYWDNFFKLRLHKDAQPEIQHLAKLMAEEKQKSISENTPFQGWHIPYTDKSLSLEDNLVVATAKAARISYSNFKGSTLEKDTELVNKLKDSHHWSPFEHCARAAFNGKSNFGSYWKQYREFFDPSPLK